MSNWDTKGLDAAILFEEALASVQSGEGLEGYTDEELETLASRSTRLLELSAALDVHGNVSALPNDRWLDARYVQRAVAAERRFRADASLDERICSGRR